MEMTSMPMKITELVFAPRVRVIWLALAGFFLGSALCPFNPPAGDEPHSIKQGETMNAPLENPINTNTILLDRQAMPAPEIETATFALG
jgi:hypothetical protein